MENETWKDIDGFKGHYQVSNIGRVKSIKFIKHRILSQTDNKGYFKIGFILNGKYTNIGVHRLVGLSFLDGYKDGLEINHKNGIKRDNRVENLEWVEHSVNMNHASVNNLVRKGIKTHDNKLSENEVLKIRSIYKNKKIKSTYRSLAKDFGVCYKTIGSIIKRKKWRHI